MKMIKVLTSIILISTLGITSSHSVASLCLNTPGNLNIVLAHGILGFDKISSLDQYKRINEIIRESPIPSHLIEDLLERVGSVRYFNGIEKHLKRTHNANVLTVAVSPSGSIRERGVKLRQEILNAIQTPHAPSCFNPNAPIHIIAHSMGGLDSRYILSPGNPSNIGSKITSLTTIGTPHNGSPIANIFAKGLDEKSSLIFGDLGEHFAKQILDSIGIKGDGINNLTTSYMEEFNEKYKRNENVKYYWTAGVGRSRDSGLETNLLLYPFYRLLISEGFNDNDGVVPLSSAEYKEKTANGITWSATKVGSDWHADHFDLVGHDFNHLLDAPPQYLEKVYRKYDEIINMISRFK